MQRRRDAEADAPDRDLHVGLNMLSGRIPSTVRKRSVDRDIPVRRARIFPHGRGLSSSIPTLRGLWNFGWHADPPEHFLDRIGLARDPVFCIPCVSRQAGYETLQYRSDRYGTIGAQFAESHKRTLPTNSALFSNSLGTARTACPAMASRRAIDC